MTDDQSRGETGRMPSVDLLRVALPSVPLSARHVSIRHSDELVRGTGRIELTRLPKPLA